MKVAIRTPARKSLPCSASQFLYTVPELPGTRSIQAGRGMILPACQVYDAGEFTWALAASVLVVPHVLIDPQHPHPPANTRSPTLNSEEPLMIPEFQKRLR